MFDPGSRYSTLEHATHVTSDGREIAYVRRRFLPRGETLPLLAEVKVTGGDRLDLIAARTVGNPEHFWRLADAENAMNPSGILEEPGRALRVPIPQVIE